MILGVSFQLFPQTALPSETDLVDIARYRRDLHAAHHHLDGSYRRRRYRQIAKSYADQSHGVERMSSHLAAQADRHAGLVAAFDEEAQDLEHHRRQNVVALRNAIVTTITCKQKLEQIVRTDRNEIYPRQ